MNYFLLIRRVMVLGLYGIWFSRSRDQCAEFLAFGIEDIIKAAMVKFPKNEYDLKSALRDLDCEVDFKEEWTGEKNKLNVEQ